MLTVDGSLHPRSRRPGSRRDRLCAMEARLSPAAGALLAALGGIVLAATPPPAAADLQRALDAARRHDFDTARREARSDAERGDPRAQALLANMYRRGYGVPVDYARAAQWYRKAAEQGDALSQYNLGVMYRQGLGVTRDQELASRWFHEAALQGFVPAQVNLGLRYARGEGLPKDPVRGYAWLLRAAGPGNSAAKERREALAQELTPAQIRAGEQMSGSLH